MICKTFIQQRYKHVKLDNIRLIAIRFSNLANYNTFNEESTDRSAVLFSFSPCAYYDRASNIQRIVYIKKLAEEALV